MYRMGKPFCVMLGAVMLSACGGGGGGTGVSFDETPPPVTADFDVTVTNLTNAQPLSPIAIVAHDGSFRVFAVGEPVSVDLEVLAEGGDNGDFLASARGLSGVHTTRTGTAVIGPGGSETVTVTVEEGDLSGLSLSAVTMLVNTNDAFTAVNAVDVSTLAVGETLSMRSIVYDAGTEQDSEGPGTIPGPADGGEGFNAERDDDADRVSMHAGVVSAQDGLATSVLSDQHRFDNPAAGITITRVN